MTYSQKKHIQEVRFIFETARAGEDGDWMSRAELQNINMSVPDKFLNYDELNNIGLKKYKKMV